MVIPIIFKKDISELLTDDIVHILECIEKRGFEARIVGGAVRNWLLGEKISDVDIATTAFPWQIMDIFENIVPTGLSHGTVTLVYKGKGYEITTLRKDIETFGRKAKVAFCKSFKIDSNRRDFTINALYVDRQGNVYDYHGGIFDISRKIVRFIGNPKVRIQEDFLRILRYFRFVAYYGDFKFSKENLGVIYSLKSSILKLSSERILSEILKIFALDDAYRIMPVMTPIMQELFGVVDSEKILGFLRRNLEDKENGRLSASERLCLVLKFSEKNLKELIQKYNFSKQIKKLLKLEMDCLRNWKEIGTAKKFLKKINKNDCKFYIAYLTTKKWMEFQRNPDHSNYIMAKILSEHNELLRFCESGAAEFSFRASMLNKYQLSSDNLRKVMKKVKEIWLESEESFEEGKYIKVAEKSLKSDTKQ